MQSRILLIEDDDELRELLARYLGGQGLNVQEAANGRDGLALAQEELVDLVVLDIMLPDINGLEVLRRLRGRTRLPVILLTARGEETDRIVGFEVGAQIVGVNRRSKHHGQYGEAGCNEFGHTLWSP